MGTAVAVNNAGGLLAQFEAGKNPYLDAAAGDNDYFGSFLKFNGNTGEFTYGEDDSELEPGTQVLVNMATAKRGWICWVEGEVEDEKNFVIAEGLPFPALEDLPDHGPYAKHDDGSEDGWVEQFIFHLYAEKIEEPFTIKLSSKSAVRSARKLLKDYGSKAPMKIGQDGQIEVPVVEIDSTSFVLKDNKKAGKKYAPVFKIVDWAEFSEIADLFDGQDQGEDPDDYADEPAPAPEPVKAATRSERAPRTPRGERQAPVEDQDGNGNVVEPETPAEAPAEGRRTRVRHAEPQDQEAAPSPQETQAATGRDSARGRRGRSRE